MKLNECDFCGSESEYLIAINDGAWAICSPCNDIVHIQMNVVLKERQEKLQTAPSTRYTIYGDEEE